MIQLLRRTVPLLGLVLSLTALHAQAVSDADIVTQLKGLRAVPDLQRGTTTAKIAHEIRELPAGPRKLELAYDLANLATEGDFGHDNLQQVTDTLSTALGETPPSAEKDGSPAAPYLELASLVRYEGLTTTLTAPQLTQADNVLQKNDADVAKADFTLTDLKGNKITLSALRGKIVMINFWATWCPPCRKEMPDLNALADHYKSQGLVVLSISDEEMAKVSAFIAKAGYTYPILLDPGRKVNDAFHIEGIPKSFVFDRDGKLIAQSIDMRTRQQFLVMLAKAGLKP